MYALRSAIVQKRPAFVLTRTELARDLQDWRAREGTAAPAQAEKGVGHD